MGVGVFISQSPVRIGGLLQVLMELPYLLKQLGVKVLILLKLTWESVLPRADGN